MVNKKLKDKAKKNMTTCKNNMNIIQDDLKEITKKTVDIITNKDTVTKAEETKLEKSCDDFLDKVDNKLDRFCKKIDDKLDRDFKKINNFFDNFDKHWEKFCLSILKFFKNLIKMIKFIINIIITVSKKANGLFGFLLFYLLMFIFILIMYLITSS